MTERLYALMVAAIGLMLIMAAMSPIVAEIVRSFPRTRARAPRIDRVVRATRLFHRLQRGCVVCDAGKFDAHEKDPGVWRVECSNCHTAWLVITAQEIAEETQ